MKTLTAFKEQKAFPGDRPWDVNTLTFGADTVTPPHYADTVEVLLCCGCAGTLYVNGQPFALAGRQVFYIAPGAVHAVFYRRNDGFVRVLKVDTARLRPAVDLDALLRSMGLDFQLLPTVLPCFDETAAIADAFGVAERLTDGCTAILRLFDLLAQHAGPAALPNGDAPQLLRTVIQWTEQHCCGKISLAEAAAQAGYEKHYFCSKFRQLTGITYLQYVNILRIQHACTLLKSGESVADTAAACGFADPSYFIKLFRRITGASPKAAFHAHHELQRKPEA